MKKFLPKQNQQNVKVMLKNSLVCFLDFNPYLYYIKNANEFCKNKCSFVNHLMIF